MADNKKLLAYELTFDQESDPQYRVTVIVKDPTTGDVEQVSMGCPGLGKDCVADVATDQDWVFVD